MDDKRILHDYPLLLARGYRRYLNAQGPRDRHDAAYYLFEIYLKFTASIAVASYLALEEREHRVNAALKGLARPSLGEWLRFLRECLAFLAPREGADPVIRAIMKTFESREGRWEEVLALYNAFLEFRTKSPGKKERVSLEALLGEVVAYRNAVLGHGAPLEATHYERFAELFARAFCQLLEESPFLLARRLVAFDTIRVLDGQRIECSVIEFMGDNPLRGQAPLVIPYGQKVPREKALHLLGKDGGFIPLDPLLIPHREDVYVLNEAQGALEYLSYSTGDRHRPTGLGEAEGELFERILGYRVDSNRLSRIGDDVAPAAAPSLGSESGAESDRGRPAKEEKLGDYRIIREVGRGAMGIVFGAVQESLGRRVALKVLPGTFALDPRRVERFRREARATARIHHPNIVPVYEVGESQGTHYYAMEFIDGPPLDRLLARAREDAAARSREGSLKGRPDSSVSSSTVDPAYIAHAVEQIALVAEGLQIAHTLGLVHRDLKPSNLLVDSDGRYVLVDFGLVHEMEARSLTRSGELVGTLHYMSPEQVSRGQVDARSDVYSLGATLYEILTLKPPLQRGTEHETQRAILFEEPIPPRKLNPKVNRDLETIILKALEKNPDRRYASAGELAADLRRYLRREPIQARPPSNWTRISRMALRQKLRLSLAASLVIAISAVSGLVWNYREGQIQRTARERLLPKIEQLVQKEDYLAAYNLTREAERSIGGDPALHRLESLLTLACTITSSPPGAEISFKRYEDLEGGWISLGTTPLEDIRVPRGILRWRAIRPGYESLECGPRRGEEWVQTWATYADKAIQFELSQKQGHPPGMIFIPPGDLQVDLLFLHARGTSVRSPGYWMDRFEVSNAEFQEFVDRGGYENPELWKMEFVRDGEVLSREKAVEVFRDRTGKLGPSTWLGGRYPTGQEKHPVAGVSWYEAVAYAEFRGKSLPTIFHWAHAACTSEAGIITRLSNFGDQGTEPVGSRGGIGFTGLSDMAGNVKEWCWNAADSGAKRRYILGGAWGEPTYQFNSADARSPWDRANTNGFRCISPLGGADSLPPKALGPIEYGSTMDYGNVQPVSDGEFGSFLTNLYTYDQEDLNAHLESADEPEEAWRREKVTYHAGYGGERMATFIYLPKGFQPPFQAVVYFPGLGAQSRYRKTYQGLEFANDKEFIVTSGRALVVPIYKGTFFREMDWGGEGQTAWRDRTIIWSKEVRRTVDYLETRLDIDPKKIAFYGFSWGASIAPVFLGLDERLRAGILLVGGLYGPGALPSADPFNFLPRIRTPVLMISGEFDFTFPLKESANPLFEHLGTPVSRKKHVVFPGGHGLLGLFGKEIRAEILAWLDRFLGPVGN